MKRFLYTLAACLFSATVFAQTDGYDPVNPPLPDQPQNLKYYTATFTSRPTADVWFGYSNVVKAVEGSLVSNYVGSSTGFDFICWVDENDSIISEDSWIEFQMPARDVHLYAVMEYNPDNPRLPFTNVFDTNSGEILVDDFRPGELFSAVYEAVGEENKSNLNMIRVSGAVSNSDLPYVARNFPNCRVMDFSCTTGCTTVPSWCMEGTQIEKLILPASVGSIEDGAFYDVASMSELTLYSTVPPVLGYNVFYGQAGLPVYVPLSSIDLYENAASWKDLVSDGTVVIMPLLDQVKALEIVLPDECLDGRYKNMPLELMNVKSGQKYRYVVTDRLSYMFNNLPKDTKYVATLKNLSGAVLAQTDTISVVDENVSYSFDLAQMKRLRTVSMSVVLEDGKDVTSDCKISWFDSKKSFLAQGAELSGQVSGADLICSISLSQALAMTYLLPEEITYQVVEGDNNVLCVLSPIAEAVLKGYVNDITTQMPVRNASVSVSQVLNGGYSKSVSTNTDSKGYYELTLKAVPASISYFADGYVSGNCELSEDAFSDGTVVRDMLLRPITGATITTNFTYTTSAATGDEPTVQDDYADYKNVQYNIYDVTAQRRISEFSVQYPNIVLLEEVNVGDSLTVVVMSSNGSFSDITIGGHIDDALSMDITVPVVQWGGINASFTTTENSKVLGILYDSRGTLVGKYSYSSSALSIRELKDGEYTLVTMGASDFFGSIYNIERFVEAGLNPGTDYLINRVSVRSGVISPVRNVLVPFFDESKFYYTGGNTSFSVNKTSVVAGNYLTLTAKIDFKDVYRNSISDVAISVELPEGISFVENSVLVGSETALYELDGNRLTIPLDDNSVADRVRFCIVPTVNGTFAPNASVDFMLGDKHICQPIGSAQYEVQSVAINVPDEISTNELSVTGTATPGSDVVVFANDRVIGKTKAYGSGYWALDTELSPAHNLTRYDIYASITTKTGTTINTETRSCLFNADAIAVKTVSMSFYNGWYNKNMNVVWDFQKNDVDVSSYYFYTKTEFTFVVDFTDNDPVKIPEAVLIVFLNNGGYEEIELEFNEALGKFVGSAEFGSSALPENVDVEFIANNSYRFSESEVLSTEFENLQDMTVSIINGMEQLDDEMFELVDDSEMECTYRMSFEDGVTGLLWVKEVDFEEIYEDTKVRQYDFFQTDDGNFVFSRVDLENDGLVATFIDSHDQFAFKIGISDSDFKAVGRSGMAYKETDFVKSLIKNWRNGNILENLGDLGSSINELMGIERYVRASVFPDYVEMLGTYSDGMLKIQNIAYEKLTAKCSDGTYKLTSQQINDFNKQLMDVGDEISRFSDQYCRYLEEFKKKLASSIAYDICLGVLGKGLSIAAKGLAGAKLFMNSKSVQNVQKVLGLYSSQKYRQEMVGVGLEVSADLILDGIEDIIQPEFTQFERELDNIDKWAPREQARINSKQLDIIKQIRQSYKKCKKEKPQPKKPKMKPTSPILDPSGFVYEAVSSNRLQGVTATCYYKETIEDMYGDMHENVVLWDAEQYDAQKNPLYTDENGMYQWDVPQGLWQVRFEKEGYVPAQSEWLPVPPPQMDVNIGMVQNTQPEVVSVHAYEDGVELEFSKYMNPEELCSDNIYLKVIKDEVETLITDAEIVLTNREESFEGSGVVYASKIKVMSDQLGYYDEAYIIVSDKVRSYSGIQMARTYEQKLDIEKKVRSLLIGETHNVAYGEETDIMIGATPADAAAGRKFTVRSASEMIVKVIEPESELTFDADGQARVRISGELLGTTALMVSLEDADLNASTLVNVVSASRLEAVLPPEASRVSGTAVFRGQTVSLSCASEGAVIYYTTDGSCPCDESKRIRYERPITIVEPMTLNIMSVGANFDESEVRTYNYDIRQSDVKLNLAEGWNWSSHDAATPIDVRKEFDGVASRVQTQTRELIEDPVLGLVGNLKEVDGSETMKIQTKHAALKSFTGEQYNPALTNITLAEGWNWLGYPLGTDMTVGDALSFLDADEGDCILSHDNGFAVYSNGAWVGSLSVLESGMGYLYRSGSVKSFIYNQMTAANKAYASRSGRMNIVPCPWNVDKHRYPDVMPVIAEVIDNGSKPSSSTYWVGAFCGDECRGTGRYENGILYLSVYGDSECSLSFMALDTESGILYDCAQTLQFDADVVGSVSSPFQICTSGVNTRIDAESFENEGLMYNAGGVRISSASETGLYIIKNADSDGAAIFRKKYVK